MDSQTCRRVRSFGYSVLRQARAGHAGIHAQGVAEMRYRWDEDDGVVDDENGQVQLLCSGSLYSGSLAFRRRCGLLLVDVLNALQSRRPEKGTRTAGKAVKGRGGQRGKRNGQK